MDELTNLQSTITKMNEDIDVLSAKRSKLQNEIEAKEKASDDKIAQSQKFAQADIDTKYAELKQVQKDSAEQIKKDKEELQHRYGEVYKAEEGVKKMIEELKAKQAQIESKIEVENNKISAQQAKIDQDMQAAMDLEKATNDLSKDLLVKKEQLDNREHQLDKKETVLNQRSIDVSVEEQNICKTLEDIEIDREKLKRETESNSKLLKELNDAVVQNNKILGELGLKQKILDKGNQDLAIERNKLISDSNANKIVIADISRQMNELEEQKKSLRIERALK